MILRPNLPGVLLSPETAAALRALPQVNQLRIRMRGLNPLVAQELRELHEVGLHYDPPRKEAELAQPEAAPEWLTTGMVADLEAITDRAVRMACQEGRIDADFIDNQWRITPAAYQQYRARRQAA